MKPRPTPVALYVVDDDYAVRDSLQLLLGLRGYPTHTFASGEEFLAAINEDSTGCLILDFRLPGKDGLAVQRELSARSISLPVIILTAHGDVATTRAALQGGAFDFLEKPIDDALLFKTVDAALARNQDIRAQLDRQTELRHRLSRLTTREQQVLDRVVQGRHNREVAVELKISPRTVEVYKARIMEKLQVTRLADLIRLVLDLSDR